MSQNIYEDIARRTGGDIYIGVVGPVRTGKSTLIKRFMETLVLPNIPDAAWRERATDEMPQSAAGKTIMTTEPKFVPEEAVSITVNKQARINVRLIDCVGYIIPSALGYIENDQPRMVMTPWYNREIPFNMAAEMGTQKVINDHSTIGLVVTTDGSISDLPREEYAQAEQRVIKELNELGKPFAVVLNCVNPTSAASVSLAEKMAANYGVPVTPVNCLELSSDDISRILQTVLYQFPIAEIAVDIPKWIVALDKNHWLRRQLCSSILEAAQNINLMSDLQAGLTSLVGCDFLDDFELIGVDFGNGSAKAAAVVDPALFYRVIGEQTGLEIKNDADLMPVMVELAAIKKEFEKYKNAIEEVAATGYGIVMPSTEQLTLEPPEIIKQGGRYGVRLKASAPSIHMMRADIKTEVAPIVGSEKQSQELVSYLLSEFETSPEKIWTRTFLARASTPLSTRGCTTSSPACRLMPEASLAKRWSASSTMAVRD